MADTLTLGVELEFIAVYPNDAFTDKYPTLLPQGQRDYVTVAQAIAWCLEAWNIPASESLTYDRWHVHHDELRLSPAESRTVPQGFREKPVEISSRILNYNDNWQTELKSVLSLLHWMRGTFNCEFLTNASTGLHVHIGDTQKHSLTTAKRIMQVATAHERNLDKLHSAERIPDLMARPEPDLDNNYAPPLYGGLSFFHASNEQHTETMLHIMGRIESKRSFAELGDLCRVRYVGQGLNGHRCTLNLDNLYPAPGLAASRFADPPTGTIEFRQHAGDLDLAEIVSYVKMLANLTAFCKDAEDAKIIDLVARGINIGFGLDDFLEFINCDSSLVDHFCNRQPRGLVSACNPLLQALVDVNDQESALRRESSAVDAATKLKADAGLYGIDFNDVTKGVIPLREREFDWMLSCARKDNDASLGTQPADIKSQTREIVFHKLATIYSEIDDSDDPDQDVIHQELDSWQITYGPPEYEIDEGDERSEVSDRGDEVSERSGEEDGMDVVSDDEDDMEEE